MDRDTAGRLLRMRIVGNLPPWETLTPKEKEPWCSGFFWAFHKGREDLKGAVESAMNQLSTYGEERTVLPLETPIEVFCKGLSVRAANVLLMDHFWKHQARKRPTTLGELLTFTTKELRRVPSVGKATISELEGELYAKTGCVLPVITIDHQK